MRNLKGTLISLIIGISCGIGISLWQMSFIEDPMTAWSNGFFTVSVLWLGLGVLTWIASFGGFDGLRYLTYVFKQKFSRKPKLISYFEFKQERLEKKTHEPLRYLLIPGAFFLAFAVIAAVLSVQ